MRKFILTTLEREILTTYLDSGKKLAGFRTLFFRIRWNQNILKKDMSLIKTFWDRYFLMGPDKEKN